MTEDIAEQLRDIAFKKCGPTMEAVHTKLIEWKAADALEAKNRRIAELEEARDKAISFVKKQTNDKIDLYDEQYAMRQRISELKEALRPFANLAKQENTPTMSDAEQWFLFATAGCVTYTDLRAARAALGEK